VVSFTPQALYPQGKSLQYPLYRRLGGPQSWSAHSGGTKSRNPVILMVMCILYKLAVISVNLASCHTYYCMFILQLCWKFSLQYIEKEFFFTYNEHLNMTGYTEINSCATATYILWNRRWTQEISTYNNWHHDLQLHLWSKPVPIHSFDFVLSINIMIATINGASQQVLKFESSKLLICLYHIPKWSTATWAVGTDANGMG